MRDVLFRRISRWKPQEMALITEARIAKKYSQTEHNQFTIQNRDVCVFFLSEVLLI